MHGAKLRNQEYRQVLKGESRELRRLRRQVKTYEALAKGEWMSQIKGGVPESAQETVRVGDESEEVLTVDCLTVKRLWRDGRDASWRAVELEEVAASLRQRLQVRFLTPIRDCVLCHRRCIGWCKTAEASVRSGSVMR
jgi:hypothetical protein